MTNEEIIWHFTKAMAVLQVIDKMPFRWRAYQTAIDTIKDLDEELASLHTQENLEKLPGIGKELCQKIVDLLSTDQSEALEKLYQKVPSGMFALLEVPGIGAKKAYVLATAFDLTDEKTAKSKLKHAALNQEIQKLEGFGEKSQADILYNVSRVKAKSERMTLAKSDKITQQVLDFLSTIPEISNAQPLGSIRRRKETIGDIDIGASTSNQDKVEASIRTWDQVKSVQASGNNLIRLRLLNGKQVDLKFSLPSQWGSLLQHFTGSKAHNVALRELALTKGISLSEHGMRPSGQEELKPWEDPHLQTFASETEFYNHLQLEWIPPELRENTGEIEAAKSNSLPKLIDLSLIKGDFHTHTDYSGWISSHDRGDSVQNLLKMASKLGYEWLALGDHNPSQKNYTSDQMVVEVSKRQHWLKNQLDKIKSPIKTFSTLEIDILKDGELAIPNAAIQILDFAIVSIHSSFTLSHDAQTKRILKALSHPKVKIMGHPTGRLIGKRSPIQANWDTVFDFCATNKIALEINASSLRLDLPDSLVRQALQKNVLFSLGTDAHSAPTLQTMNYALGTARRGWVDAHHCLNTKSKSQLQQWFL